MAAFGTDLGMRVHFDNAMTCAFAPHSLCGFLVALVNKQEVEDILITRPGKVLSIVLDIQKPLMHCSGHYDADCA